MAAAVADQPSTASYGGVNVTVVDDHEESASSDSEGEDAAAPRNLSINVPSLQNRISAAPMKGHLLKKVNTINAWKKRWCFIDGNNFYYGKNEQSSILVVINLINASVAEQSDKNLNNAFQIIAEERKIQLQAENRSSMEKWMTAFRNAATILTDHETVEHRWCFMPYDRQALCNVCGQTCSSVIRSTLACDVCEIRVHKRCAAKCRLRCKWTDASTVPEDCRLPDGGLAHQWMQGNLPLNSRCSVCRKPCGSSKHLKDHRCLWCKDTVHEVCRLGVPKQCSLGKHRASILSPTAIHRDKDDPSIVTFSSPSWSCPLAVFVNPKSGSNDGVCFLRNFKHLLNPLQVFDVTHGGPRVGLRMFRSCPSFRALGCGGDGTIGWILQEADRLGMNKLQLGVLPLGTGNDLARVLCWGAAFSDKEQVLSEFIDGVEKAKVSLLDRWSVQVSPPTDAASATPGEASAMSDDEKEEDEAEAARKSSQSQQQQAPLLIISESGQSNTRESIPGRLIQLEEMLNSLMIALDKNEVNVLSFFLGIQMLAESIVSIQFMDDAEKLSHRLAALKEDLTHLRHAVESYSGFSTPRPDHVQFKLAKLALASSTRAVAVSLSEMIPHAEVLQKPFTGVAGSREISVVNNYFGIGLDAKVALDFDTLRKQHPEKCRSRIKNQMWYGVLGGREMFSGTCRNLQSRLEVYCDGVRLELPKLQGVVVLNIPSYMGGTNFWGTKVESAFRPPLMDDGLLEIVSVKGSTEMAACKALPGISPTRLAQAREIEIRIKGSRSIPVQVDGEAWPQDPCVIRLSLKNRVQMLTRDREFHKMMASWTAKGPVPTRSLQEKSDVLSLLGASVSQLLPALTGVLDKQPAFGNTVREPLNVAKQHHSTLFLNLINTNAFVPAEVKVYVDSVANLLTVVNQSLAGGPAVPELAALRPLIDSCEARLTEARQFTEYKPPKRPNVMKRVFRRLSLTLSGVDGAGDAAGTPVEATPTSSASGPGTPVEPGSRRTSQIAQAVAMKMASLKSSEEELSDAEDAHQRESSGDEENAEVVNGQSYHEWSARQVASWLQREKMLPFAEKFYSAEIKGSELDSMNEGKLRALGLVDDTSMQAFSNVLARLRMAEQSMQYSIV
eukprot:m.193166 g.193166  ORF g.193166 m.193166 type:complete len:1123 (-) comp17594_c0_seq1:472-3840(-)